MNEKMQTATDEAYRDATNLQAKLKKHEAFEAELQTNRATVDAACAVSDLHLPKIKRAVCLTQLSPYTNLQRRTDQNAETLCLCVILAIDY